MPGPTDTAFFERAGLADTRLGASGRKEDPQKVADQAFEGLMAGRRRVVAGGLATKAQVAAMKVLPDKAKAVIHRLKTRPGSAR